MYVSDQYAERDFYRRFGFVDAYEGDEFPGFLAIRHGDAVIGLQRCSPEHPPYAEGLRWQFELTTIAEVENCISVCREQRLDHEVVREVGGTSFLTTLVRVVSPSGVSVWFEGPNESAV
ncbi:hypothetical protein [Lapillicoccus sp.]|uniref:hypothetical protein n=1 Tax=Lapillicoccus sp. TaxID=1909287 RepID=UPI00326374C5